MFPDELQQVLRELQFERSVDRRGYVADRQERSNVMLATEQRITRHESGQHRSA
jgi:hypothetical protein